jgi:hypothetical protein
MKSTAKNPKFPDQGDAFDYRFDVITKEWVHWESFVQAYEPIGEKMYQNIVISTVELERMKYVLDLHVNRGKPVLYVGTAGTRETTVSVLVMWPGILKLSSFRRKRLILLAFWISMFFSDKMGLTDRGKSQRVVLGGACTKRRFLEAQNGV